MLAGAALASTPDEAQSTLGSNWPKAAWRKWIVVEGYTTVAGVRTPDQPDANPAQSFFGSYEVTINNNAGSPLSGVSVCIDFSGCPDVRLSCDQLTPETGQTLVGTTTVCGNTNAAGKFTFKVQGGGKAAPLPPNGVTVGSPGGHDGRRLRAGHGEHGAVQPEAQGHDLRRQRSGFACGCGQRRGRGSHRPGSEPYAHVQPGLRSLGLQPRREDHGRGRGGIGGNGDAGQRWNGLARHGAILSVTG
jgi:hypothetical protein